MGMKGWVKGPALRDDLPEPEGDVVAVKASSVNNIDRFTDGVLGHDFAGVTDDGAEVFGFVWGGAWAERIAVGEHVAPKPASLSMAEAGAAPVAGLFALVYVESLNLRGGERVLVVGANGGSGAFAVQLCAAKGATVIAPALEIDEAYLTSLGVAEIVNRDERPAADHVIDFVSPPRGIRAASGSMADLGRAIDELSLRVPICEAFSFGEIPAALEAFGEHKQGKLSIA
jgi:NADPH:quinone reductase-like Zn-dependent oxidoreductase